MGKHLTGASPTSAAEGESDAFVRGVFVEQALITQARAPRLCRSRGTQAQDHLTHHTARDFWGERERLPADGWGTKEADASLAVLLARPSRGKHRLRHRRKRPPGACLSE